MAKLAVSAAMLTQAMAGEAATGFLAADPAKAEEASYVAMFETFYHASLVPLCLVTMVLGWMTRPKSGAEPLPEGFSNFQWRYLAVWAPAIMADWLQGPYVYALYASYGFSGAEIAELFVAGFGASMVFGTFVGSLADAWGRKKCAILYCVLYILSCMTKHSNNYSWLMVGRITGGIATSLLFSTFECWMVAEHCQKKNFSGSLLRYMFGVLVFTMYLTAIVAGLMAQTAADAMPLTKWGSGHLHYGGYTTPFDLSIVFLTLTIPLICFLWEENYGNQTTSVSPMESLGVAFTAIRSSWRIAVLGLIVSCFEGSMYAFVFNWTPALQSETVPPPYGLIFSAFMMACMCGASLFSLMDSNTSPAKLLLPVFVLSALALSASNFFTGGSHLGIIFAGFLLFEMCVGIYFPAMGSLKSEIVPEEARAGVYNMYRVPLNAVVVGLLLTNLSTRQALCVCSGLLALAAACIGPVVIHGASVQSAEKSK
jgi:MFS family permease